MEPETGTGAGQNWTGSTRLILSISKDEHRSVGDLFGQFFISTVYSFYSNPGRDPGENLKTDTDPGFSVTPAENR